MNFLDYAMKYKSILVVLFFSFLTVAAQQNIDVQHYRYEIELTDKSDAITGKALIKVKFLSPASEIRFDLASVQDDKGMYAFQVMEGGKLLRSAHLHDEVLINLLQPAMAGEIRTFEINYIGTPVDGLIISKNKFGDRTFFADNWPNRAHQWIPCIDRPDDKASFEFYVTAPDHYQVVSNGLKMEESKLDQGRKMTHWKEDIPLPTKVMVIGVAEFAIKKFPDSPDSLPVSAWIYPQDSTKGFYDYGVAPAIVKFFVQYIASFPYKKLANVQSKTIFGGMENAGAIFYAEESVTGDRKWEDVLSHEIVHQWFGDMASEKSFAHLWLSEGFATYLTDLYFEKKYNKDSAAKRLQKERKEIESFVKSNNHAVVDSTSDLMSLLNVNSYQKGAWVLHMLRVETGDTVFQKIIREYYNRYKGSNADTRDFEKVAEEVSGKDLTWFFDQWLYKGGIPELEIKTDIDKEEVKVKVKQLKNIYRLVMEVGLVFDDGKMKIEKIEIGNKEVEYKWKVRGVKKVVIDPGTKLLYALK